jgi:4-carboxymuconolactone decarboxylase
MRTTLLWEIGRNREPGNPLRVATNETAETMKNFITSTLLLIIMTITITVNGQDKSQELDPRQQSIVAISSLTAVGDLVKLKSALNTGLDAGLTVNEIKEVLMHLYAYCGFPRSLRGIQTFMAVLDERKAKGINDKLGRNASPITDKRSKYERGKANLGKLSGMPQDGPPTGYAAFAPEIEVFLKEHLFADLFDRDVLTYAERELVTVSVNASIGGVEPMLRSHMGLSLTNGISPKQLNDLVSLVEVNVGKKEADAARTVLIEVLKSRKLEADANLVAKAQEASGSQSESEYLFPKGEKFPNANYTGDLWVQYLAHADSLNPNTVSNVTFAPGARSHWHSHPAGQIILGIGGVGYYQEKGQPKKLIRKGDVINCAPNVVHWHGASSGEEFIQLTISPASKLQIQRLGPVTDEDYNAAIKE